VVYLGGSLLLGVFSGHNILDVTFGDTTFTGIFFRNFTVFVTLTQMKTALYKAHDLITCHIGVIICQKALCLCMKALAHDFSPWKYSLMLTNHRYFKDQIYFFLCFSAFWSKLVKVHWKQNPLVSRQYNFFLTCMATSRDQATASLRREASSANHERRL